MFYYHWKYCSKILLVFGLMLLAFPSCTPEENAELLFEKLSHEITGITFENKIQINDRSAFVEFPFIFNGGGVAIGDINNDGLPDVYLTGNMVSSRLYLNKGNFDFEDITESSGTGTNRWATGASFVDINSDGFLDLYVSVMGPENAPSSERRNQLFINNGDLSADGQVPTFTEAAEEYGIDFEGYTTHAAFFDYDGDEYLDLFLLNNSPGTFARARDVLVAPENAPKDSLGFDKLFKNNGKPSTDGQVPTFTDVSDEAGIERVSGYGLGVAISDFNRDGRPDIYVSNDISSNDVLYMNNGDGTFSNKRGEYLKQTSFAGMGIDAADVDNNGWPDIIQIDMMPEEMTERKQLSGAFTYERFQRLRQLGYHYYYSKNSLQLNRGIDSKGNVQFSEIGRMAGVAYTDWSWTALFADLDNSGHKDIMITNGYPKAVNNFDYLLNLSRGGQFGTEETAKERRDELYRELHGIEVPNYLFQNSKGLQFKDVSAEWGFRDPGFSYGAATADLNNDGSMDIVINNINDEASVYKNHSQKLNGNHYLQLKLEGNAPNTQGLGSEIKLFTGDKKQYFYHTIHRGYQSTVDERIHIGLGRNTLVDSLLIKWPDSSRHMLRNLEANQLIILRQHEAQKAEPVKESRQGQTLFKRANVEEIINYTHTQGTFSDFLLQPLLPYMISRSGPAIAVGDVTGDGLDDMFIGGPAGEMGSLFIQNSDGVFIKTDKNQFLENDAEFNDTAALFFDANGDGLNDLYVASGGYQISPASDYLQDRLYINRGEGRFTRDHSALPRMLSNTSVVEAEDFTGDGRPDLFVGGGTAPGNYPFPARSYLLVNNNGQFSDRTGEIAPELSEPGIIADAIWVDHDGNGTPDLITAGEWLPIQIYENDGERLRNVTEESGLENTKGWWFSLAVDDFNGDGNPDIVAGNAGLNHTFSALNKRKQVGLYAGDFNRDQHSELIFIYQENGDDYPVFGLAKLGNQIPDLTDRFTNFRSFASVPMQSLFSAELLQSALYYEPETFASMLFQNNGDGTYSGYELPDMAQISTTHAILAEDFDEDGHSDLLLAGNMYHTEPNIPRLDAGKGLFLKGNSRGEFYPVPMTQSGFVAPLDAKKMVLVKTAQGYSVIVVNAEGPLQLYRVNGE